MCKTILLIKLSEKMFIFGCMHRKIFRTVAIQKMAMNFPFVGMGNKEDRAGNDTRREWRTGNEKD